jgi:NAD(P)-dependent dehydrogenase (short-subunit alcohol dehydrogenase family)
MDSMGLLDGKVAVITGAGSGMAKASTRVFVREGARVLAADVSGAEKDTAAEVGDAVVPFHCDVTKEVEVEAMIARAVAEFGRVDAVLNVAGIGTGALIANVRMEDYDKTMDVDLRGVLLGMKYGIRAMLESGGGVILNWSSVGGLNASPYGTSVYSAAKAAVLAVTKAAAVEYGAKGIRANAICPGFILTEVMGARGARNFPEMIEKAALKRAGEPIEVAEVAAFLASDRASFLTGAVIPVDGGWSARLA